MAHKIKPVRKAAKGHNRYCGPAALSIVTGVDTAEAAALLRKLSGRSKITGTSHGELLTAFAKLGWQAVSVAKVDPHSPKDNPTLAAWLRETHTTRGDDIYLVSAGYHWQVVQGRKLCCSLTSEPVFIRNPKVKRRGRLRGVWKLSYNQFTAHAIEDLLPDLRPDSYERQRRRAEAAARSKAKRLAVKYGIEIEVQQWGGGADRYTRIIVWGPRFRNDIDSQEADPYSGDHYAEDWQDALERVETYVKLVEEKPHLLAKGSMIIELAA